MASLRMALAQMQPTEYDLITAHWPLHRLLEYLDARGLKGLLDELEDAMEQMRREIEAKA